MSKPTDDQLRDWADPFGTGFPPYWESEHNDYIEAMSVELLQLRAVATTVAATINTLPQFITARAVLETTAGVGAGPVALQAGVIYTLTDLAQALGWTVPTAPGDTTKPVQPGDPA